MGRVSRFSQMELWFSELPPSAQRALRKCWASETKGQRALRGCSRDDIKGAHHTPPNLPLLSPRPARRGQFHVNDNVADTGHARCGTVDVSQHLSKMDLSANDGRQASQSSTASVQRTKQGRKTSGAKSGGCFVEVEEYIPVPPSKPRPKPVRSTYSFSPAVHLLPSSVTPMPSGKECPGLRSVSSRLEAQRPSQHKGVLLPYSTEGLLVNWSAASEPKLAVLIEELSHRWSKRTGATASPLFVDLGCGDGRVVISVCRVFPDSRGLGVDLNGVLITDAHNRANREGVADRCDFRELDLAEVDLTGAAAVFLNLPPPAVRYVTRSVLPRQGLAPGAALFSADCPLPEGENLYMRTKNARQDQGLFCYDWLGPSGGSSE